MTVTVPLTKSSSCLETLLSSRSETDLNRHWEVSAASQLLASKPRQYNSHHALQHNLSIEDAFDRAMSLPSSPTVKTAQNSFDSYEEEIVKKPRSSSEKTKKEPRVTASPSSSLGLGRKTFLEGLKMKSRTRSGDNLTERGELSDFIVCQSDEKLTSPARRQSESARQVRRSYLSSHHLSAGHFVISGSLLS